MRTTLTRRALATSMAGLLMLGGATALSACSDEDGDGGVTDEEIQDGKDTATSIKDEVKQEIDAQDEGSNEDGE